MATRLANEIRPTNMPPYCSACYDQKPQKRYVDFDAASDRGWTEDGQSMDDLILCEDCIRSAAVHVNMRDTTELEVEIEQLRSSSARYMQQRNAARTYAKRLEEALAARSTPVKLALKPDLDAA